MNIKTIIIGVFLLKAVFSCKKFLHLTDIHLDLQYKPNSSYKKHCHRGTGTSGIFGHPKGGKYSCDTPNALVEKTFNFISSKLLWQLEFILWTGDNVQ